ncbi:MAG: type IV toxin-antitoxin system AbiEi family antitoxin domain-containing protein [Actinobacteria bacterium]|nr:type IV toxin-antitoxin system AbiEi family antitoxin domain-containing protein [Actinomycetota bacterium]
MESVRARLAAVARPQFGAFSTQQAEQAEVLRKDILRLREQGEVVRLFRGVYAFTLFPDTWEMRAVAAQLVAGASAALSHLSAALVLGLPYLRIPRSPELELTVPRGRRRWSLPLKIHESLHIRPIDVVEQGPFRVTSVEWTLCSLAFGLGLERFERALAGIVARGRTTRERMAATAERFDWCTGAPTIRAALLRYLPEVRWTRSRAERAFLRILRDAGLPLPEATSA